MLRYPSSVFLSGCSCRLQCSAQAEGVANCVPSASRSAASAVMDATNVCACAQGARSTRQPRRSAQLAATQRPGTGCAFWHAGSCSATRLVAIGQEGVALARLHDAGGDELAQRRPALPRPPLAALFARDCACLAARPCAARARRLALLHRRLPSQAVLRRPLRLALRQPERDSRSDASALHASRDLHAPRTTPLGLRGTASACALRAPRRQAVRATRELPLTGKEPRGGALQRVATQQQTTQAACAPRAAPPARPHRRPRQFLVRLSARALLQRRAPHERPPPRATARPPRSGGRAASRRWPAWPPAASSGSGATPVWPCSDAVARRRPDRTTGAAFGAWDQPHGGAGPPEAVA
jgi:hypothetical protein